MKTVRKNLLPLLCSLVVTASCGNQDFDVCVYGGSASGVVAAYSAASLGQKVLVVEPSVRIGGLTTGGLGYTDIGNKRVVRGVALDFYRKTGAHYGSLEQWVFEPGVAKDILEGYLSHPNITTVMDRHICSVVKEGTRIKSIAVACGENYSDTVSYSAKSFIDCSYEGDLMALAGVSYRVGREDNSEYNERYNGVELMTGHQFPDGVDPYVIPGVPESGLLYGISDGTLMQDGTGDSLVQAYNYRICLTDSLENMIPITRPENYDSSRYELLARLYAAQPGKTDVNQYFIWSNMPGRKTDVNNRGGFSTDMIGASHSYPEASWEERQEIVREHKDYTLGLLYFTATDPRVPASLQEFVRRWGLPKDEYIETGHWTPQLYIRECRRMVGEYVATQADCESRTDVPDGIAYAAYNMDSHNCQRIVIRKDGRDMVKNEGNVEKYGGGPYPISYRSITPKREQCTNLLVPVCMSASHIAYGSIRMEPVFMCLGQCAGIAASIYNRNSLASVQEVTSSEINNVIETDPFMDGRQPDIILDDSVASVEGDWKSTVGGKGYGPTYYVGSASDGHLTYTATIPSDGVYDIYSYQCLKADRMNPVSVFDFPDGRSVTVNSKDVIVMGQTSGAWHKVTSMRLKAGEEFTVNIHGDGSDGHIQVDALMLIKNSL